MDKLKQFLQGKPWYVKVLVILLAGLIAYFSTGCAYKLHIDRIDNMSRELFISKFNE